MLSTEDFSSHFTTLKSDLIHSLAINFYRRLAALMKTLCKTINVMFSPHPPAFPPYKHSRLEKRYTDLNAKLLTTPSQLIYRFSYSPFAPILLVV